MPRKRNKSGYNTHDVIAEWTDSNGVQRREKVGIRSVTNNGECVEILFKTFPVEISVITAIPLKKD